MFHLFKRAAASIPNAAAGKLRFFIDTDDRPKLKDENGNLIDLKTQDNFSGDYNDLTNKPNITGTLLAGLTTVAASAITATDSIIGALAKLQASVETKADAANTLLLISGKQNKLPTDGTAGQFLAHDLTFKTPSGGGGSATPNILGCGFQCVSPLSNSFYDNSVLTSARLSGRISSQTSLAVPVFFSQDFTISQMGVECYSPAVVPFKLYIYDSMLNGFPKQMQFASPTLNQSNNFIATSVSFTFLANKVYWVRIENLSFSDDLSVKILSSGQISLGADALLPTTGTSSTAAAVAGSTYFPDDVVGAPFRYVSGRNYSTHGESAVTAADLRAAGVPRIVFKAA